MDKKCQGCYFYNTSQQVAVCMASKTHLGGDGYDRWLDNRCLVPDGAIITRDDKRFDKTEFIRLPSGAWELVEPDSE